MMNDVETAKNIGFHIVDFFENFKEGSKDEIVEYVAQRNSEFPLLSVSVIEEYVLGNLRLLIGGNLVKYNDQNNKYKKTF